MSQFCPLEQWLKTLESLPKLRIGSVQTLQDLLELRGLKGANAEVLTLINPLVPTGVLRTLTESRKETYLITIKCFISVFERRIK